MCTGVPSLSRISDPMETPSAMASSWNYLPFEFLFCLLLLLQSSVVSSASPSQDSKSASRNFGSEHGAAAHEVHCSRERSRAASKIIAEYLTPFLEKERYQLSENCRLHHENNLYRDQEEHKMHVDLNEWKCGYCGKRFYEEKYLDMHFDNRHYEMLNVSHVKCFADLCGALHCDAMMDFKPQKSKCNPAAAARNKHLCESLADNCFPGNQGPTAIRLHEFFLRQFCDAHTCKGGRKPFSRGRRKRRSVFYLVISILVLMLLPVLYLFIYLYQRGIRRGSQELRRISRTTQKKKPS
ncbi:hypothetical protein SAY87_021612 [Trapa incisa]|uniref:C2H2-type domain-containing protein n=1 Tax=Trapa incisa TaxID=236973 RepID=A0AAN7JS73_9MYRT|nr:hypothetical protein SAY87_021612 [Trapa incisa]